MNIAAADIAAPSISTEARPPKRRFTEMDEGEGEAADADSDELYGWVEDDDVAAEGLLIDDTPLAADVDAVESRVTTRAESPTDNTGKKQRKVTRPATL